MNQQKQRPEKCRVKAQMGNLGHKGHFKLERRGNGISESKQSSEVKRRHRAWREMLGKMAGV